MEPSVVGASSDTHPMFFSARSSLVDSLISVPASARQYISITSRTRVNSTLDDSVSSVSWDRDDSIRKYASPPSSLWSRMAVPSSNHWPSWVIETFSSARGQLSMKLGTASGAFFISDSAIPTIGSWCSLSTCPSACPADAMEAGTLTAPASCSPCASRMNRVRWSACMFGSARADDSNRPLTWRQVVSVSDMPSRMKVRLSSPSIGKISCEAARHSAAMS